MNSRIIRQIRALLKCLGISIVVLLSINLAIFLLGLIFYGLNETWEFHFKYGVFSLNDRMMGLKLFEPAANGLILLFFLGAFAQEFKQPQSDSHSK